MNETRSGVNDRPRPSVVSRSSRRQLPTVTSSSGTEPEGRGWSDKRRMWEGAWKERECSVAKGPDRHAPSLPSFRSLRSRPEGRGKEVNDMSEPTDRDTKGE